MKNILFILSLLFVTVVHAQLPEVPRGKINVIAKDVNVKIDSLAGLPFRNMLNVPLRPGAFQTSLADSLPYHYDGITFNKLAYASDFVPIPNNTNIYYVIDSTNTPPGSPSENQYWLIGGAGTGIWAAHSNEIAHYTGGSFTYIPGVLNDYAQTLDDYIFHQFNGTTWPRASAPPVLIGGNLGLLRFGTTTNNGLEQITNGISRFSISNNGVFRFLSLDGTGKELMILSDNGTASRAAWAEVADSVDNYTTWVRGPLPSASATTNIIYPRIQADSVFLGATGDLLSNKPQALFHVNGTGRFSGAVYAGGIVTTGTSIIGGSRLSLGGITDNALYNFQLPVPGTGTNNNAHSIHMLQNYGSTSVTGAVGIFIGHNFTNAGPTNMDFTAYVNAASPSATGTIGYLTGFRNEHVFFTNNNANNITKVTGFINKFSGTVAGTHKIGEYVAFQDSVFAGSVPKITGTYYSVKLDSVSSDIYAGSSGGAYHIWERANAANTIKNRFESATNEFPNLPAGTAGTDNVVVQDATTGVLKIISPTYYGTGGGGSTTFAALTDVNLTSVTSEDFIKWDGTDWINRTPTNVRIDLGLVIGTNVQAYDADLTTYAGLTPTTIGQNLITLGNPGAITFFRANADNSVSLRTAAEMLSDIGAQASGSYQPLDADLTDIAGLTATTDNFIVSVASAWASRTPLQVRTTLGLIIGTDVQAYDADLTTYAGITPSANVQTLLAAADYAAFKTSLSLNNVENTAISTWAGSANITTLGTIATGVWSGTTISIAKGGTGKTSIGTDKFLYSDNGTSFSEGNFKEITQTTYAGTITYTAATTAPSGTETHTFKWTQIGHKVTLRINLKYSVAGTAVTAFNLTLPAGCPTPEEPTGFGGANDIMYLGVVGIAAGTSNAVANNGKVALAVNSGDTGYILSIASASNGMAAGWITIEYFTP